LRRFAETRPVNQILPEWRRVIITNPPPFGLIDVFWCGDHSRRSLSFPGVHVELWGLNRPHADGGTACPSLSILPSGARRHWLNGFRKVMMLGTLAPFSLRDKLTRTTRFAGGGSCARGAPTVLLRPLFILERTTLFPGTLRRIPRLFSAVLGSPHRQVPRASRRARFSVGRMAPDSCPARKRRARSGVSRLPADAVTPDSRRHNRIVGAELISRAQRRLRRTFVAGELDVSAKPE